MTWNIDLLAALAGAAISLSGYGPPKHPINFEVQTQEYIDEVACGGDPRCPVVAFVAHADPNTIILGERLNPERVEDRAVVVHEVVHVLQHDYQDIDYENITCEGSLKREWEAYGVSNAYLLKHDKRPVFPPLSCGG